MYCRFTVYTVYNFCDCNLKIISSISEQHLNNVRVRRRIGLKIVKTLSVYFTKKCKLWVLITCLITKCLGRFINLVRVKLSFTLERVASNEYPLQTYSEK